MKIFLDILDLDLIKKYSSIGILSGVTTNPTFARRFGMYSDLDMISKVRKALGRGEIHVEAFGETAKEIIKNANFLSTKSHDRNLVFKIPFSEEGVIAVKHLVKSKKKTSLHLIYSINQALLAATAGSTYICPLVGRLDDIGHDALANIDEIKKAYNLNSEKTLVMVSSIRHPRHVLKAYLAGADAATIPPTVLEKMFYHPMTDTGVSTFKDDIQSIQSLSKKNINKNLIVNEKDPLKHCLSLMIVHKSGAVVVCSENKLVGIFTTGDLKRLIQKGKKFNLDNQINKFMAKKPISISVGETVQTARELMHKHKIDQLAVVDNGSVLGILDIKEVR